MRGFCALKPDERFLKQDKSFWAHVRTISQQVGYTDRRKRGASEEEEEEQAGSGKVKVPTLAEVVQAFKEVGLTTDHIVNAQNRELTDFGNMLFAYFTYRADMLNTFVAHQLMNVEQAEALYTQLRNTLSPKRPPPMNKQKKEKKKPAYFTAIINMLVEAYIGDLPCDYDPHVLTTVTRDNVPLRTLARRLDGAFTSTVNPIAVWEIKEYYY